MRAGGIVITLASRSTSLHLRPLISPDVGREAITVDDVKKIVAPHWQAGHHTAARRLLSVIELTLGFAIAHGWRLSANVASWEVFKHIAPHRNGKKHHKAVGWRDAPEVYAKLGESKDSLSALALQLIILSGCRSGAFRPPNGVELTTTGRCMCGDIRFEYHGEPIETAHCHCESCRRHTSSPFATFVVIERQGFRYTRGAPVAYASSPGVERPCGAPTAGFRRSPRVAATSARSATVKIL